MATNTLPTPPRAPLNRFRTFAIAISVCFCVGVFVLVYRIVAFHMAIDACFYPYSEPYPIEYEWQLNSWRGIEVRLPRSFQKRGTAMQTIGTAFATVPEVHLINPTAANVNAVAQLNGVENLLILGSNNRVDAGAIEWKDIGCHKLKAIDLFHTNIRDGDLRELLRANTATRVSFKDEPLLTVDGLRVLQQHQSLTDLTIDGPSAGSSAEWREFITGLSSQLSTIDIEGSFVNDDVIQAIAAKKTLRRLTLTDTQITDRGLGFLATSEQLDNLFIRGGHLSRDGLAQLAGVNTLRELRVSGCTLDPDDREYLAKLMPQCSIHVSE